MFARAPLANADADRVTVRMEVSGSDSGREMRVSAVATRALAGRLLCADVAA